MMSWSHKRTAPTGGVNRHDSAGSFTEGRLGAWEMSKLPVHRIVEGF
jgi:hypothetical protein